MHKTTLRFVQVLFSAFFIGTAAQGQMLTSVQVVDRAGNPVKDAVVEIEATKLTGFVEPAEYVMGQINFQFSPRVLPVPQGALVSFPNQDKSRHHVYSFSEAKTFELKLYGGDQAPPIAFEQAGIVAIGCNIHDSMTAHIYVSSSGLYAVTDATGQGALPAYEFGTEKRLQLWHIDMNEPIYLDIAELTLDENGNTVITLPIRVEASDQGSSGSSLRDRLQGYQTNGN